MRDIRPVDKSGEPDDADIPRGIPPELHDLYQQNKTERDKIRSTKRPQPNRAPLAPKPVPAPKPSTPAPSKPVPTSPPPFRGNKVPVATITVQTEKKPSMAKSSLPVTIPPTKRLPARTPQARHRAPHLGQRERVILASLLGLIVITVAVATFIFLPTATVTLVLRTAPLLVDETIIVRADQTDEPKAVAGTAFFREVEVAGESPVTSTEVIGEIARGSVVLINRTLDEQPIKERSRLITKDDQLFYLVKSATIPAGSGGTIGSTTVEVEAAEAGTDGNIEPQRLDFAALDSSSRTLVYAEVRQALTGGAGETVQVVKEEDLANARKTAAEQARTQVEQEIRAELPDGWVTLDESWTSEFASFDTEVKSNERHTTIPYKARIAVRVIGYEQAALEAELKEALTARLDKEYMLFPGPISYTTTVEEVDWQEGQAKVATRITHTTIPQLSLDTLKQKLNGRSETEAKSYLEGLSGVRSVDLKLWPFWVSSIPRIENRIKLDLRPERQP